MEKEYDEKTREENVDLSQLPKTESWFKGGLTLYQGCWYMPSVVPNIIRFQNNFQAQDKDIIFSSYPKSGATWMKALLFSITNRDRYTASNTPLLASNPHSLEFTLFSDPPKHDLTDIPSPRPFTTHMSYASLPKPVVLKSRVVYFCRNPLDTVVSLWHFMRGWYPLYLGRQWTLEGCVETFCKGESGTGPFWVHVLGFWRASLENPENVLFLKYEDLLEGTASHVKRIAEFVGFPFSEEEERGGVVDQIVDFCSFGNMKNLDVNKNGNLGIYKEVGNDVFF